MQETILFFETYQRWIFALLALGGVVYIRFLVVAVQEYRKSIFGLERERARSRIARAAAMLVLIFTSMVATFVVVTFISPALPASARPTPIPTVFLLATSQPAGEVPQGEVEFATSIPDGVLDTAGCANPLATFDQPLDGDTINGVVEILGTANIPSFAFYKIEYNDLSPDGSWLAISANTETICETEECGETNLLGSWDTSLVTPGDYAVRLVVTDTLGNAPLPCTIRLRVIP
jgi:hypothetical protein